MPREQKTVKNEIQSVVKKNATVLTWVGFFLVLSVGVTLVNDPSKWWMSLILVLLGAVVTLLFVNARAVLKFVVSFFIVLLEASFAFRIGADMNVQFASLWMMTILAFYALCLAFTFAVPRNKSRWNHSLLATISYFVVVFLLAPVGVSSVWISFTAVFLLFCLIYCSFFTEFVFSSRRPLVILDENFQKELYEAAINSGRGAWKRNKSVIIWNDSECFQLSTIQLEEQLSERVTMRKKGLSHKGMPISGWLYKEVMKLTPSRGISGADVVTVFLDTANRNGRKPKTIAIPVTDSKNSLVVGILPVASYLRKGDYLGILTAVEKEFGKYAGKLSEKQVNSLDSHLLETKKDEEELPSENKKIDESPSESRNPKVDAVSSCSESG